MTKRFGFTLAEVLITLTIIGVIAAMTIPTLLSNTADQEYKTGLKKAISTINQAITMQYALEGTDMTNYTASQTGTSKFDTTNGAIGAVFQQRMQVINTATQRGDKGMSSTNAAIYLSDGMVIEFPDDLSTPASGSTCAAAGTKYDADSNADGCLYQIIVDVNGDKGTCTLGGYYNGKVKPKDCFVLNVHPDGVRPSAGYARDIMYNGK